MSLQYTYCHRQEGMFADTCMHPCIHLLRLGAIRSLRAVFTSSFPQVSEYNVPVEHFSAFRYRVEDVLKSVTRLIIKEAA